MSNRGDDHRSRSWQERAANRDPAPGTSDSDRGLTEPALRALRVAATLTSVAAGVSVRVGDGQRTAVEVRRPPTPRSDGCVVVPPCHFRTAVGRAHAQHVAGQAVEMTGLDGVRDPVIEIGLAPSDAVLPGGVYRLTSGEQWTFLFGTTLGMGEAMRASAGVDDVVLVGSGERGGDEIADPGAVRIAFHHDEVTRIVMVHTTVPELELARADAHLGALHTVLARCAAEELVAELAV